LFIILHNIVYCVTEKDHSTAQNWGTTNGLLLAKMEITENNGALQIENMSV